MKVLDFGLAKAASATPRPRSDAVPDGDRRRDREGVILGTAAYMSPEQARGQPVDKRTDIWAFGCVLYEMLTGRPAFAGDSVGHDRRDPRARAGLDRVARATPAASRLLRRCLEKTPGVGCATSATVEPSWTMPRRLENLESKVKSRLRVGRGWPSPRCRG